MKVFNLFIMAVFIALCSPVAGRSATGESALKYYVGTWSCTGGPTAQKPVHATVTYTMNSGMLENTVNVSPQGNMKTAYIQNELDDVRF